METEEAVACRAFSLFQPGTTAGGNPGCLYEAGNKNPYEGIVFEEVTLSGFEQN